VLVFFSHWSPVWWSVTVPSPLSAKRRVVVVVLLVVVVVVLDVVVVVEVVVEVVVVVVVVGTTPAQMPLEHTSLTVFGLPSSQAVPSGASGFEHVPAVQIPATWH